MDDFSETYDTTSSHLSTLSEGLKPRLHLHEWVAILSVLGFLLLLTGMVLNGPQEVKTLIKAANIADAPHFLKPAEIEVFIEGAVKQPGAYKIKNGALIKDAIALAEPMEGADLSKLNSTSRLRNGQSIKVLQKQMYTICVSGAVQKQGEIIVPKGTRLSELAEHIVFLPEADLKKFSRTRYLKNNEKIVVPVQSPKINLQKPIPRKKRRSDRQFKAHSHSQRLWPNNVNHF